MKLQLLRLFLLGGIGIYSFSLHGANDLILFAKIWSSLKDENECKKEEMLSTLHKENFFISEKLLHKTVLEGNASRVKFLLEAGCKINEQSRDGFIPLHYAAYEGLLKIVKLLVQYGVNINLTNNNQVTALHFSCFAGRTKVVRYLLEKGALNSTPLKGNGCTPLHSAALGGHTDIIKLFLEKKIPLEEKSGKGFTILHYAAYHKHIETIKFLVQENTNLIHIADNLGYTALHHVALKGEKGIAKILVKSGALVNIGALNGSTPLCCAVLGNNLETVRYLIKKGAFVNVSTIKYKMTPLLLAANIGSTEIVKHLIENGADIKAVDERGLSSVYYAKAKGFYKLAAKLEEKISSTCKHASKRRKIV